MSSSNGTAQQMRAFRAEDGAREAQLQTVNVPQIGPQDVLIKVVSVGLSPGPFTLLAQGRLQHLPSTFGHEVSGVVAEIGHLVRNVSVNQRVYLYPNASCGACKYCSSSRDQMCPEAGIIGFSGFGAKMAMPVFEKYHDGGLADYIRAPYWLVDVLPDNVSFDVGAKLHEVANAARVLKVAELPPGATVVITAPTGNMGTACLKLARYFGISHLILVGRSTERLEAVKKLTDVKCDVIGTDKLGEDWMTKRSLVQRIRQLQPQGVDSIIDFMPHGADVYQVIYALSTHGSFVHMGANMSILPVPLLVTMVNCWRIIGTRNHSRADVKDVLGWLQEGRIIIDDLITHRYKLDDIKDALKMLTERHEPAWMLIVNP